MKKLLIAVAVTAVPVFAVPGVAAAAPSDNGQCRQDARDAVIALFSPVEGTMGDAISDGWYGNEPNIVGPFEPGGPSEQEPGTVGGRVVPSQSPGPKVTNPDGSVRDGASWGEVQQTAIKSACNA